MPAGLIGGLAAGIGSAVSAAGVAGTVGALGAAVSAGTGIAGALSGGDTQSGDISGGQGAANAEQTAAYNQYSANEQPYISSGQNALSGLGSALGLNGADATAAFEGSPGFAFAKAQGLSGIDDGAASTGTLRTGNTVRAEDAFTTGLADQNYNQYVGQLNSLATLGQSATSALGGAGVGTAAGIAGTDTSAATAQAKLAGQTSGSISNALSGLAGNQSVQNALSGLGKSAAPAPTTTPGVGGTSQATGGF